MGDPAVFARTGPDGAEDYLELGLLVIEQLFFLFLEELHDIPLQQQLLALTLQVLRFEERRTSAKGEGGAHHRTQVRQSRPALRAIPRSKAKPRAPHLEEEQKERSFSNLESLEDSPENAWGR